MLFPKQKMRFTTNYQGDTDPKGWIMLEITNADLEGVNKLYISLEDIEKVKAGGDAAADRLKQARALLGGIGGGEDDE